MEELTPDRDYDRVYEFPCNQWLADDRGDRRISRDLYSGHDWGMTSSHMLHMLLITSLVLLCVITLNINIYVFYIEITV